MASSTERELLYLRRVRDLSERLAAELDLETLLPLILDAAIELTEAERGFLVRVLGLKPGGGFRIRIEAARGFDRMSLQGTQGSLSRTVIRRVLERGERGLVTTSEEDADVLAVSSVQARRVRSIVCLPMVLRGEVRGLLYLDHRFERAAFTPEDLPILRTFADQAALALETAQLLAQVGGAAGDGIAPAPAGPPPPGAGPLVAASAAMRAVAEDVARAARSWAPLLILGESGSGKQRIAREVHARGVQAAEPFVVWGRRERAQPTPLLEDSGTLYLDEVGELTADEQEELLRSLRSLDGRAPGGGPGRRVIAATRHDLRVRAGEGAFRAELFYRLDALRVVLPPLRERPADIPLLLTACAEQAGGGFKLRPKARELLLGYAWPGNVRELRNEAIRLAALGKTWVAATDLSAEIRAGRGVSRAEGSTSGKTLDQVQREMVEAAMRDCGGNKARAARQLGIPRSTLYHLLARYEKQ